ncbi:unnamed protein product [Menidia menidia]|uniref:Carboxymethylenebutenolidase homolog n=1 Tax=Menidia menidia TaxID=238744 RepID=A0A8S4ATI6_9TELE|nr:unnamed protein product [Menidia menidia]
MANEGNPCPCDIGDRMDYGGLGQEVQIEHVKAYVVKPTTTSDRAIIVIQDIFGWQLPNTRYMADMLAANGYTEVDAVLKFLKEQCGANRIGVVGFCWGGIATHYLALQYPEIKAGVSVYGLVREGEDRFGLKSPTLFIFAEKDEVIPLQQVQVLEAKLKEKCSVDYEVKIFPGQTHGFVHRKREDINPADKPYIQEARADMLNWFNKYM